VTIVVDNDRIGAFLNMSGLDPNIPHMAHIHSGSTCATSAADTNGDGFVDVVEASAVGGGILVGITGDMSSYTASTSTVASANSLGNLISIGSGSLTSLIADLHRPAPAPTTGVASLSTNQPFNPAQYTVDVHGIDPSITLPSTVQTLPGMTANQTLPVACGSLQQTAGPQASPAPSPSPSTTATPSATPSPSVTASAVPMTMPMTQ
jgi:hypothetical protein